jgi:hypothetical protein
MTAAIATALLFAGSAAFAAKKTTPLDTGITDCSLCVGDVGGETSGDTGGDSDCLVCTGGGGGGGETSTKGNNGWGNGADPSNPGSNKGRTAPSKTVNGSFPDLGKININPTLSNGR